MLEEVSARVAADPELIIEIEFAESSPKGLGKCIRVRIGGLPPRLAGSRPPPRSPLAPSFPGNYRTERCSSLPSLNLLHLLQEIFSEWERFDFLNLVHSTNAIRKN